MQLQVRQLQTFVRKPFTLPACWDISFTLQVPPEVQGLLYSSSVQDDASCTNSSQNPTINSGNHKPQIKCCMESLKWSALRRHGHCFLFTTAPLPKSFLTSVDITQYGQRSAPCESTPQVYRGILLGATWWKLGSRSSCNWGTAPQEWHCIWGRMSPAARCMGTAVHTRKAKNLSLPLQLTFKWSYKKINFGLLSNISISYCVEY